MIDSTFTADAVLHPFGINDTLYSLKISGHVELNSDTCLVRVVVGDEDSIEYMVFEAYPLITDTNSFNFYDKSDETTYLNGFLPKYLKIFVKHSNIHIDYLSDSAFYVENLDSLQCNAKKSNDLQKLQIMNQNILDNGLEWIAGENELLHCYYKEKKVLFGFPNYNLQGFDYYIDGVFSFLSDNYLSNNNSLFVRNFNWTKAHNADIEGSAYYDPLYGWITDLRNQKVCGSCSAFGSLASVEAITNLYYNQHINCDLSEQELFCCTGGDCDSGLNLFTAVVYASNNPVHDENCYIYNQLDDDCCVFCPDNEPEYSIVPDGYHIISQGYFSNPDTLKSKLIRKGPYPVEIFNSSMHHVMTLVGFKKCKSNNDIEWIFKDSSHEGRIRNMRIDPEWIKSSYVFENPVNVVTGTTYIVNSRDEDNDGYYNWGIGPKPEDLIQCYDDLKKDSNDDDKTVGPYDEYFYGIDIHPEIAVYLDLLGHVYVENKGFIYFNSTDITLSFFIENQGSAKLNLNPVSAVSLECDQPCPFILYTNNLEPDICMNGGTTSFDISYSNSNGNGDLTIVKIDVLDSDNDIIDDFEFALVKFNCTKIPGILEVDESDTWNGYRIINQDMTVLTGVTLQITGNVAMAPGAEIIVEGGAELIIDGGTITGACDEFWKGIDVWGDEEYSQYDGRQGKVRIMNGGTIKHALCAIETGKDMIGYYLPSGGIVQSNGGVFEDNIIGVRFFPYHNFNPQTGNPENNLSRFKNTSFLTTQNIYDLGEEPQYFVHLNWVEGILFKGNSFRNEASTSNGEDRGIGIKAATSGFYVYNECADPTSNPCSEYLISSFEHLDYGIKVFGERESLPIVIDSAVFHDNLRGIFISGMNGFEIYHNSFEMDVLNSAHETNDTLCGIYLEACRDFVLEENVFTGYSGLQHSFGVHTLNLGPYHNKIYNNYFNNIYSGITAVGENRNGTLEGLCINCNDFADCETDIYVTPEEDEFGNLITGPNIGIAQAQGEKNDPEEADPTLAAGNTFTENSTEANLYNHIKCEYVVYTHHNNTDPPKKIRPDPVVNTQRVEDIAVNYSKETACPSNIGGGIDIPAEMNTLTTEAAQIDSYQDTLSQVVDGGDTDGLNLEVQTSFPNEALQVRQELLNESPYLSDTVMKSAIYKENVLPNVMVRDVLVANPQSAKSIEVLDALDDRFDPMPDYMIADIMQGQTVYGAKELLEQKLAKHKTNREKSLTKLIRHYINDTLNIAASTDSIISLLQNENYPYARYQLAMLYLGQNDSANAFSTLDNIPIEFDLTPNGQSTHELYEDLLNIQWQILTDTTGIDSLNIQTLFEISDHFWELPGIYARNILINEGLLVYNEMVYFPDLLKSSPVYESWEKKPGNESIMRVFPNPAGTYFIVEYDLREYEGEFLIIITDIKATIKKSFHLQTRQNQQVVSTDNYPAGVYIVQLFVNGNLRIAEKLVIVKQ